MEKLIKEARTMVREAWDDKDAFRLVMALRNLELMLFVERIVDKHERV